MSLKDFYALHDDDIVKRLHEKGPDIAKLRKAALKTVQAIKAQFEGEKRRPRNAHWKLNRDNDVVLDMAFVLGSENEQGFPQERFPDALAILAAAIEAGELDDAMTATWELENEGVKPVKVKPERKKRQGWTPEERERRAAARAARNAAKNA